MRIGRATPIAAVATAMACLVGGGFSALDATARKATRAAMSTAVPARAPAVVEMTLELGSDGGGAFDTTDRPGLDSGANNGIARTGDTITYVVNIGASQGSGRDVTFTLTAVGGTEWSMVPQLCTGAGSRITDTRLLCNIGQVTSEIRKVSPVLRVTNRLRNGDQIRVTGTFTSDGDPPRPVAPAPPVTVSAAPAADLIASEDQFGVTSVPANDTKGGDLVRSAHHRHRPTPGPHPP